MLEIAGQRPTASESIGWQVVEEISIGPPGCSNRLREVQGRNGRLDETDPRLHRDAVALADQAERFSTLAPNVIVKIPATHKGIAAIEDATARGVSMNVTVSFTVPRASRRPRRSSAGWLPGRRRATTCRTWAPS
jgi:transaldolase